MEHHHDMRHLLYSLELTLSKEHDIWMPVNHIDSKEEDIITAKKRNEAVSWIFQLHKKFSFYPETFFHSVALLDNFLSVVKAQPKYLKCIALTCFYITIKLKEEDEIIPSISELIEIAGVRFSKSEINRMELCILKKINWNVSQITALDFLQLYYGLLLSKCRAALASLSRPVSFLHSCARMLETYLLRHEPLRHPPSVVALSAFTIQLKPVWIYWKSAADTLQALVQINDVDLEECINMMSKLSIEKLPVNILPRTNLTQQQVMKRKVEKEGIYDGIKRLYSDDDISSQCDGIRRCYGDDEAGTHCGRMTRAA